MASHFITLILAMPSRHWYYYYFHYITRSFIERHWCHYYYHWLLLRPLILLLFMFSLLIRHWWLFHYDIAIFIDARYMHTDTSWYWFYCHYYIILHWWWHYLLLLFIVYARLLTFHDTYSLLHIAFSHWLMPPFIYFIDIYISYLLQLSHAIYSLYLWFSQARCWDSRHFTHY